MVRCAGYQYSTVDRSALGLSLANDTLEACVFAAVQKIDGKYDQTTNQVK